MVTSIYDKLRAGIATTTAEETRAIASEFAATLPADTTLALHGDLGVGKTTFTQGLAQGLGVMDAVTSPTFTIFTVHRGLTNLVHLDAYRLETARQVDDLLLLDFLVSPWCLVIEWPEKIADWVPANALHLDFGITPTQQHTLRLR